jgi:hypothetical protein
MFLGSHPLRVVDYNAGLRLSAARNSLPEQWTPSAELKKGQALTECDSRCCVPILVSASCAPH